jgi:hypothetical protein
MIKRTAQAENAGLSHILHYNAQIHVDNKCQRGERYRFRFTVDSCWNPTSSNRRCKSYAGLQDEVEKQEHESQALQDAQL